MADAGSVVVIGAGTAGNAAARFCAKSGWQVTQIEHDRWGGTCLWRGCIPKKSLYQAAKTMRAVTDAEQFGVVSPAPTVDWQTVLGWKWHAQTTFAGDQVQIAKSYGIEVVQGTARFVAPDAVRVAERTIQADRFVIATGSVTVVPPVAGADLADDSNDALHYESLPASLVIVGGGFIAFEMAGIFASFGTEVTVVTRPPRFLEMLDPDLTDTATRQLAALGVRFIPECTLARIDGSRGDLAVSLVGPGGEPTELRAERVLMAIGRRPCTTGLDLEEAGVEVDEAGHIVVDHFLRTTNPDVWVAGDAAGGMMQTPVANLEGRTVARSIVEGVPLHPDCHAMPVTCFTVPQLATVGLTEEQARAAGVPVRVNRIPLSSIGAAIIEADTDGFIKLVLDDKTGKILGAHIAAPTASDLIYPAAVAVKSGLTAAALGKIVGVHPSHAELVYYAGD